MRRLIEAEEAPHELVTAGADELGEPWSRLGMDSVITDHPDLARIPRSIPVSRLRLS